MISYHKPYLINNEKNDKIKLNHFFSGAPYSYGKQKETNELIFSWLSWLAVLLVARTLDGGRETCSLGLLCTSLVLDIHVMIN